MELTYFNLNSGLNLNVIKNDFKNEPVTIPIVNNQIFIFDFSGSMWGVIEEMAIDVCNKISELSLNELNTFTFIWFSSENQYGTIVENYKINSIDQLENLKKLIKKNFRTLGCTSFGNPLKLAYEYANKIKSSANESVSLWFLSDGCHNDGSRDVIYKYCDLLQPLVDTALFVEYGNYCDRRMMSDMSSALNGELITSANFSAYQLVLGKFLNREISTTKKIVLDVIDPILTTAYVTYGDNTAVVRINNNQITVNENYTHVMYLSSGTSQVNNLEISDITFYKYALYLIQIGNKNYAKAIFKYLQDNYYYNKTNNAIGKPSIDLVAIELSEDIANNLTYKKGKAEIIENDMAFCFFDLLEVLSKTDAEFFPYKEYGFDYKRISAERTTNGELNTINKSREKELLDLIDITSNVQEKQILNAELNALYDGVKQLKEQIIDDINVGYSFKDLVWNKDVPNLSIRVKKSAQVDISSLNLRETVIPTSAFRTYNIVLNGGYYNVEILPCRLSKVAYTTLNFHGVIKNAGNAYNENMIYQINLKQIPTINNSMIKNFSFESLCELEYKKLLLQADEKTLKHFIESKDYDLLKETYSDISETLISYGFKSAGYGITYTPKNTVYATERLDFIEFLSCSIKIKSFSTIPSIESVITKNKSNKSLTPSDALVNNFIQLYESASQEDLKLRKKQVEAEKFTVLNDLAKIKFIKLVGGENFVDIDNIYDNPTHKYTFNNTEYTFTYEESIIKEKI